MTDAAVREADADELSGWDALTVEVPDGDVKQSLAWAAHRRATGSTVHFLATDDGGYALAIGRRRPIVGGGRLYVPRGPVGAGAPNRVRADRLADLAGWARRAGYDEIVSDAEVRAESDYPMLLRERGFRAVEELEPSRHRMATPIPPGITEAEMREAIEPRARQPFTAAERKGHRVIRHDLLAGDAPGEGFEAPADARGHATREALERFHDLLATTGERRGFRIGSRAAAVAWWTAALAAGHLLHLEIRGADDVYLGGSIFMRHGTRLSYGHAADVVERRSTHPGVAHLGLWRALQLAIREGRTELDLGGVDVAGARGLPAPDDAMYGLYKFKRAFLGEWIEQTGAHAQILRPTTRRVGLAMSAVGRLARGGLRRIPGR